MLVVMNIFAAWIFFVNILTILGVRKTDFIRTQITNCLVTVGVTYSRDPIRENVRSKTHCAAQCLEDERCSRFLYCPNWENNCNVIRVFGISKYTQDLNGCTCYTLLRPVNCLNGGLELNGICDCLYGFYGKRCESVITDCKDGHDRSGGILSADTMGQAYIQPIGIADTFPVYCLNKWGGYTYIQNRREFGPKTNFYRNWNDYVNGFGDIESDYWIGLEQIHALTHKLNALEVGFFDGSNAFYRAYYRGFKVDGRYTSYVVNTGRFNPHQASPPFEDSLKNISGMFFTTYDHNPFSSPCPADMLSGWWFNKECTEANLNGPALTREDYNKGSSNPRITWKNIEYIKSVYLRISV